MRILKYPLSDCGEQVIWMPVGAKILTVQVQREVPCIWALADDTTGREEARIIRILGTGHEVPPAVGLYIGSYQLFNGSFVGHVFENFF